MSHTGCQVSVCIFVSLTQSDKFWSVFLCVFLQRVPSAGLYSRLFLTQSFKCWFVSMCSCNSLTLNFEECSWLLSLFQRQVLVLDRVSLSMCENVGLSYCVSLTLSDKFWSVSSQH